MHPCEKWRWRRNISILAEMEQVDYEDYSIGGTEYEKLLAQHTCELDETTWDRVPFGSITVDH
mgnify:CR=1 FL=1